MARDRNLRQRVIKVNKGTVSKDTIVNNSIEVKDISGKGLYLVIKYNNKIKYIKWEDSPL